MPTSDKQYPPVRCRLVFWCTYLLVTCKLLQSACKMQICLMWFRQPHANRSYVCNFHQSHANLSCVLSISSCKLVLFTFCQSHTDWSYVLSISHCKLILCTFRHHMQTRPMYFPSVTCKLVTCTFHRPISTHAYCSDIL
jgi:hypothetical protein